MRQTISGLVAAFAVVTVSAAPALACGGGLFTGSCSPCGQAYVSPCGQGYYGGGYGYGYGGVAAYERLPDPSPQYYYANQGPTYSGPGMFAPVPTYQESAVSGWGAYNHNTYYGYDGGRYANATNHYYDGMSAAEGPAIYGYRSYPRFRPWRARTSYYGYAPRTRYGYSARPSYRYGYAPRHSYAPHYSLPPRGYYAPHYGMRYGAPRYAGPRYYGHREHVLRRYY
jgi:hypothetical protein